MECSPIGVEGESPGLGKASDEGGKIFSCILKTSATSFVRQDDDDDGGGSDDGDDDDDDWGQCRIQVLPITGH